MDLTRVYWRWNPAWYAHVDSFVTKIFFVRCRTTFHVISSFPIGYSSVRPYVATKNCISTDCLVCVLYFWNSLFSKNIVSFHFQRLCSYNHQVKLCQRLWKLSHSYNLWKTVTKFTELISCFLSTVVITSECVIVLAKQLHNHCHRLKRAVTAVMT